MTDGQDHRPPSDSEETVVSGTDPPRSDSSGEHGRFLPGARFGRRYRIVGLLGRGGMGEVYRADDLELGQTVALKLLPARLDDDGAALARLRAEVRLARQVSHPNVCRVYDLGEEGGQHFLSMEYVDGEDLSVLLRRIGRLPREKGLDIARQLCAGLAAAHETGILHRDLKPANIIIDGRGRVRIMDFGLATLGAEGAAEGELTGTPAYMAPERLTGAAATVQSDLFAMGLVLHELFTGERVYPARTLAELREMHVGGLPSSLTGRLRELDPAVERAVLRCLEPEPGQRPRTAAAVAASLPGGDPLAAALAAGETPSPEMVAAAGGRGGLSPGVAALLLALAIAGLAGSAKLNDRVALFRLDPTPHPPVVLAAKAREILARQGYARAPVDTWYRYHYANDRLYQLSVADSSRDRWDRLRRRDPGSIHFRYRESAHPLKTLSGSGAVWDLDPPPLFQGMASVVLDPDGRLLGLDAVPREADLADPAAPDYDALFADAGLDRGRFRPGTVPGPASRHPYGDWWPLWAPDQPVDSLLLWRPVDPAGEGANVTVRTGTWSGRVVYFERTTHWPDLEGAGWTETWSGAAAVFFGIGRVLWLLMVTLLLLAVFVLIRRRLRAGQADRRGALRFAVFGFTLNLLAWIFDAHHLADPGAELDMVFLWLADALFEAFVFGFAYLALEPTIRRYWPGALISWSRLLAGRLRDPRVGRDILLGAAGGIAGSIILQLAVVAPAWFGQPPSKPLTEAMLRLGGAARAVAVLCGSGWIWMSLVAVVTYSLLLGVLRRRVLAMVLWWIVFGTAMAADALGHFGISPYSITMVALIWCLATWLLLRVGFLAMLAFAFIFTRLRLLPVTLDLGAWYGGASLLVLLVLAAILAGAARAAAAGPRPAARA
ncbi:MAG: protein kinase [Candidatus Krumholzibacteriota bacterium]|nr:protein kinase [Candidatus Krumholzibacteriota bacterium]